MNSSDFADPRRPRRLRRTEALRTLVRESTLAPSDLVYPLFVQHGQGLRTEIASMPGQARLTTDLLPSEVERVARLGIQAVLLFGLPRSKDETGSENFASDGIVQQAVKTAKDAVPEMLVATDVCMCSYTVAGHCGLLDRDGHILNDESLSLLARTAVSHAEAGADLVAPSGMLDGMVHALRTGLDEAGFDFTGILSYAVKYASSFYGPFREAADGAPRHGDRKTYQMDPANLAEALKEVALDIEQGADMVMVKPAMAFLDVVHAVKQAFPAAPLAAYNVSGEYAMLKATAKAGWISERDAVLELLLCIKRAGADVIISYHAPDVAAWLSE